MAKKPEAKPEVIEGPSEELLLKILMEALIDPERGTPVLIGPTQWGKTKFGIEDLYVKSLGIARNNIVMMNPQNDLPEDLGGWPTRQGQWLEFTQPANIPPRLLDPKNYDKNGDPIEPWGIFVDELDKAREETLSAMLTFFNPDERRLRNTRIHPKVPIIAAMNEPENRIIPEPLLARLLFLPFPPPGLKVASRTGLQSLGPIADELFGGTPEIKFPLRPKAPGSLHKLSRWLNSQVFWDSEVARKWIVRGLFNEAEATVVLSRLRERMPEPTEEWARQVSPTQMVEGFIKVLNAADYDACVKILQAIEQRTQKENDPTGEMERMFVAILMTPELLHAVHRPQYVAEGVRALKKRLAEMEKANADQKARK